MRKEAGRALTRSGTSQGERHADRALDTREQLIAQATRIFATKGYAAASTREICQAAGANIAAIHYHFGDKEGLYRAVLTRPIDAMVDQFAGFDDRSLAFDQAIRRVLHPLIALALDDDPNSAHVERLHLREAIEPSAVFRDVVGQVIAPHHAALTSLLARHCGLRRPDAAIHQLAFAVVAMANHYCMSREFMRMLAPELFANRDAVRRIVDRLVEYSVALLDAEKVRRGRRRSPPAPSLDARVAR